VTFGDFVITDWQAKKSRVRDEVSRDYRRGWLVWLGIVIAFGVILVRLATMQVFFGARYAVLADENRIRQITLRAPRGQILDRRGEVLADSVPQQVTDPVLKVTVESWARSYPVGEAAAHVIGTVGEVSEDEVGLLKEAGQKYSVGDSVGRSGLELQYEDRLRGMSGGRLVEVDNLGQVVRELGRREAVAGVKVQTTLDAGLLRTGFQAMNMREAIPRFNQEVKGGLIVSRPMTGEVLALVSAPSFEPNLFAGKKQQSVREAQEIEQVLTDSSMPMLNRAIGGAYPPASTFKMVTTAAALESKKADEDFDYVDTGVVTVGSFRYTNWLFTKRGGTEGLVDFVRAIARSTDTFFYKVGEMTGPETMAEWAGRLGLGEKTGIDLPGEIEGLIGTPEWKERVRGERWFLGNTFHMAIGQGDLLATPAQINMMTNILASGGLKCPLHVLADADNDAQGKCSRVNMAPNTLTIIKEGMVGACSAGGTAFPLFGFDPQVACKTGTAEYVAQNGKVMTHGWLTAYAPLDDPQISVTVVIEGGGEGSNVAAPIVRQILAKYFAVDDTYNYAAIPQQVGE